MGIGNLEHGLAADTEFYSGKQPDVCPDQGASVYELTGVDIETDGGIRRTIADLVGHSVAITSTLAVYESFTGEDGANDPRVPATLASRVRSAYDAALPGWQDRTSRRAQMWQAMLSREMQFERRFAAAGGRLLAGGDPTGWGVRPRRLRRSARAGDHAARDPEPHAARPQCHRWTDHAPRRLYDESARAASHRARVWLVEDDRVDSQSQAAWPRHGRLVVGICERCVQSDPIAEVAADRRMTRATCLHWRAGRRAARDQWLRGAECQPFRQSTEPHTRLISSFSAGS